MFNNSKYTEIQESIKKQGKITKIVAISKNHKLESVQDAIKCGVQIFGENRVQEAVIKFTKIKFLNNKIKLHLTGPLQTNKVKQALEVFDVFQTLDRTKLLREFLKYPKQTSKKSFFIQINTGKEMSKSGIYPEEIKKFIATSNSYQIFNIVGLMCIPPINESPKKHFTLLQKLSKEFGLKELSIGMSSDYIEALNFNPTYIRLGTLLFGERI